MARPVMQKTGYSVMAFEEDKFQERMTQEKRLISLLFLFPAQATPDK